jgi:hypothetical protein
MKTKENLAKSAKGVEKRILAWREKRRIWRKSIMALAWKAA